MSPTFARSLEAVNFSYAYAAAMAAVAKPTRLTQAGADVRAFVTGVDDDRVLSVQERVTFSPSAEIDSENRYSMDTAATVRLHDGRSAFRRSRYGVQSDRDSEGTIAFDHVTEEDIARKFHHLAGAALGRDAAESVATQVLSLDRLSSITPIWKRYASVAEGE